MHSLNTIPVELTVILGKATMPINQLLRMGRGAVITLETFEDEQVQVRANNIPIAHGEVAVQGDQIAVEVRRKLMRKEILD